MYLVLVPKRVIKAVEKIPEPIRKKLVALVEQLHEKETVEIEVYYVGSRQNAPY